MADILYRKTGKSPEQVNIENATARMNNLLGTTLSSSERFDSIATHFYGGTENRNPNTFLGIYNKYYKAATGGRSRYDRNTINNRGFNQLMIMDRSTLGQIQPFIGGRFILVPGDMPRCMEILHPEETEYMRTLFQSCVTSVSGFNSRRLDTTTVNAMTEQNSFEVITKQSGATRNITITFMTLFQDMIQYRWISTLMQYIYNPGSSAATYPHFTGLAYHEGNHSMNFVYVVVDPSFQIVYDAAIIYAAVPTDNLANSILDQTWGTHDHVPYAVPFKVSTINSTPQVNRLAYGVLADYVSEVELHDYYVTPTNLSDPDINTMGLGNAVVYDEGKKEMKKQAGYEKMI